MERTKSTIKTWGDKILLESQLNRAQAEIGLLQTLVDVGIKERDQLKEELRLQMQDNAKITEELSIITVKNRQLKEENERLKEFIETVKSQRDGFIKNCYPRRRWPLC